MNEERLAEIERLLRIAEDDLSHLRKQSEFVASQIASLKREREGLLQSNVAESPTEYVPGAVTSRSHEESKIRLFRALFRGREDVYPRRSRVA
jgi:hypothetical protein